MATHDVSPDLARPDGPIRKLISQMREAFFILSVHNTEIPVAQNSVLAFSMS